MQNNESNLIFLEVDSLHTPASETQTNSTVLNENNVENVEIPSTSSESEFLMS